MKVERDHGDHFYLPPDDTPPQDTTLVEQKETNYVQTRRGVLEYPVSADEYYSRQAYDFLDENRGTTAATAANTVINFGRIVKALWITCPTGSASSLFVNFQGAFAGNVAGSIQIVAGETRQFFLPVSRINLAGDGVGAAGFRVTWGF